MHNLAGAPLDHHLRFCQKRLSEEELFANGGHLAQLATGKAREIYSEFESVFRDTAWAARLQAELSDASLASSLIGLQVGLVLSNACGYWRRVITTCDSFPLLLTWFILLLLLLQLRFFLVPPAFEQLGN